MTASPRCQLPGCSRPATWASSVDFATIYFCAGHAERVRSALAADPQVTWPDGTRHRLSAVLGAAEEPRPLGGRR